MRFLASYWWLLLLPAFLYVWAKGLQRTPRPQWVWILRIGGVALLLAAGTWLVTGDIDSPYLRLHFGGWSDVVMAIALGCLALLGAHRLASKQGPPA